MGDINIHVLSDEALQQKLLGNEKATPYQLPMW